MKKILLSSILAFGLNATAQTLASNNTSKVATLEFPNFNIEEKLGVQNPANAYMPQSSKENNAGSEATGAKLLAAPNCAINVSPIDGSTGAVYEPIALRWDKPVGTAVITTYDIYIGFNASAMMLLGSSPTLGANIVGTTADTTYYWKIVPKGPEGPAVGCNAWSFTTMSSLEPYCGPIHKFEVEPISFVNFKFNTENVSPANSTTPHENFTTKTFKVEKGGTTTISVNSNIKVANRKHFYSVFVDWNQNGNFNDPGETYFTTAPYFSNSGSDGVDPNKIVSTDFTVPETAILGSTRMRIKAISSIANTPSSSDLTIMANPCTNNDIVYGQAEDYTIEVVPKGSLAVANVSKGNLSVYPNPFKDILKISDIKNVVSAVVTDISGRRLLEIKPTSELNLSQLKKGVYIISLKYSNGEVKTTKVIKE